MSLITILIISFFIIAIVGTLLHFTHNWLKNGFLLHIFSAVNESTWEHMKLLVAPTLVVIIFQVILLRNVYDNLWNGLLSLYLVEIITIPLLYEPLRVSVEKVPLWITITIFYLAIIFGLLVEYYVFNNNIFVLTEIVSLLLIILITLLFGIFTFHTPKYLLFKNPITGKYGDTK